MKVEDFTNDIQKLHQVRVALADLHKKITLGIGLPHQNEIIFDEVRKSLIHLAVLYSLTANFKSDKWLESHKDIIYQLEDDILEIIKDRLIKEGFRKGENDY